MCIFNGSGERKFFMAKEAIEKVRAAEAKAAQVIQNAELTASEMLAEAGKKANDELEAVKKRAADELGVLVRAEKAAGEKALSEAEGSIAAKCEERRMAMLAKKEAIINEIIEAVKAG